MPPAPLLHAPACLRHNRREAAIPPAREHVKRFLWVRRLIRVDPSGATGALDALAAPRCALPNPDRLNLGPDIPA